MINYAKKHWLKLLLAIIVLIVLGAAFILVRPDSYLPHKRITIHVPYSFDDTPISLIPMGEKIYHPNAPSGHPGIDIQWSGPNSKVLASADGKITSIKQKFDGWNKWRIEVQSGPYVVRYTEMENYNTNLKAGMHVKQGDFIGYPANPPIHNKVGAFQIHWEFASVSVIRDRFCPMTYFDDASRKSIEAVWAATNWQYKSQYPDICNGDYANKVD